jgi:ELWxxDGT repeat protein
MSDRARSWTRHLFAGLTLMGALPGPAVEAQAVYLVRDVLPGAMGSNPSLMTDVSGTLFFVPATGFMPPYLWKSDGTTAGTVLVKEVDIPNGIPAPDRVVVAGGVFFFVAQGPSGQELWKSDGTEAGTVLVKDINPGAAGSFPHRLTAAGSLIYFHAMTATHGRELWRSDGTEAGTFQVKDVVPGSGGSMTTSGEIVPVNGIVYFNASSRLWRTDGTEPGTSEVGTGVPVNVEMLTRVQDVLFFRGSDGPHGNELWKTDGTAAGTQMVKDVTPGFEPSNLQSLTAVGATLFFVPSLSTGHGANELWRSDGTEAGTVLVEDIYPGYNFQTLYYLTAFDGRLYFRGENAVAGNEVWTSDGTAAGTGPLDIIPGTGGTGPGPLTAHDGRLFFEGRKAGSGPSQFLWKSDGTLEGTVPVAHGSTGGTAQYMASVGGRLFVSMAGGGLGGELWVLLPLSVGPDQSVPEGDSGSSTVTVTLTLAAPSDRAALVSFATEDGTAVAGEDYLAVSGTLDFPPGVVTRTIDVTVLGDTLGENDETFSVRLSNPVNADPTRDLVRITITNDDPPGFRVSDVVVAEGRSGPATATFRVDLFPAVAGASVAFATADGTAHAGPDYTAASGVRDFTAGQNTHLLTVTIHQDALAEGVETFFVNLSSPVGGTIVDGQGLGRILDAPGGMDFNGDRFTDLVWRMEDDPGLNGVWFMNGVAMLPGTFPNMPALADTQWTIVGTNDFNADGRSDLLWRHATEGQNVVWFMNGPNLVSGTFTTPAALPDVRWKIVGTGDFDIDGKPDILWRHLESGQNVLWYMNGTVLTSGTFTDPPTLADVRWSMAGVGDFNRDGRPDILWHHRVSGELVLWYMNDNRLVSGTFTTPSALADTAWKVGAVGDYNGDDRPDIVWRHQGSGQIVAWFMNDATLIGGSFTSPDTIGLVWRLVGPR